MNGNYFKRLFALTLSILFLMTAWQMLPLIQELIIMQNAQPRAITPRGDLAEDEKTTIELFNKTKDSVVYISTAKAVIDPWTRNIYNIPKGTGSGFVWDHIGHIVTNYHVVQGASEARVRLSDGRDYPAVLIGASPSHDLAVLRINVPIKRPQPVPIGTSHDLKVGQKTFAIGNPFGLDWTLTTGIISALDRSMTEENGAVIRHLIQTDAAINPGNSGGPLLDSAGRLIGVNTAIYSPSGAYAGIGFAIPIDTVNRIVPQLIAYGKYLEPSLGIEVDERINQIAQARLGFDGVMVLRVIPGTSAYKAGLQGIVIYPDGSFEPGDIILSIDGKAVKSVSDIRDTLENYKVGDVVSVEIARDGKIIKKELILEAARG
ncbi:S1C family serine protease [Hydrogenimonas thermophila]|uniref:DegP2 peptidase. Serine peptidase. MEROPS family S01B n=1 Tax=Hydrogenimonas thermophila TaxID=223786 RepID=A0A1I5T5H1_9BACT|nr:trypsin-like peptidase domain-containing protein [Hydrogenimonas thermophila]WOE69806.1 trypsin-like peptidase domain-containing protein [Hydrogenimonas thermophila]WOE72321.1 trypsin-like peptidase domain-containing protein [Hydrogenimonas thermophila]SFP77917.1 DegP2 peptidase. Serine peptidase. MEROPS family S01B [Hydrogenimonas thermophila]